MSQPHEIFSTGRPACPQCRVAMNLHNTRVDPGKTEQVTVYLCITHGFFHVSESQPLRPGM